MHGSRPATALRLGRYKLVRYYETGREELYDLEADPAETTDLAAAQSERVRGMAKTMGQMLVETAAKMPAFNPAYAFDDPELRELLPFESTRTKPQP
jgi:hypothetical protein